MRVFTLVSPRSYGSGDGPPYSNIERNARAESLNRMRTRAGLGRAEQRATSL